LLDKIKVEKSVFYSSSKFVNHNWLQRIKSWNGNFGVDLNGSPRAQIVSFGINVNL
jgi:hypothetical protein